MGRIVWGTSPGFCFYTSRMTSGAAEYVNASLRAPKARLHVHPIPTLHSLRASTERVGREEEMRIRRRRPIATIF